MLTTDIEYAFRAAEDARRPMYADLPDIEYTLDRAGFVRVEGKRVFVQPGEHLKYQTCTLLTCQRCGRRAIAHPLRVVSESDVRIKDGRRYFHALADQQSPDLCGDCAERERQA